MQTEQLPLLEAGEYAGGIWYYEPHTYQPYRYVLGRVGRHPLVCIGINPSTAQTPRAVHQLDLLADEYKMKNYTFLIHCLANINDDYDYIVIDTRAARLTTVVVLPVPPFSMAVVRIRDIKPLRFACFGRFTPRFCCFLRSHYSVAFIELSI